MIAAFDKWGVEAVITEAPSSASCNSGWVSIAEISESSSQSSGVDDLRDLTDEDLWDRMEGAERFEFGREGLEQLESCRASEFHKSSLYECQRTFPCPLNQHSPRHDFFRKQVDYQSVLYLAYFHENGHDGSSRTCQHPKIPQQSTPRTRRAAVQY